MLWPEKKGAPACKFPLTSFIVYLERGQLEAESNCEQDVTGLGTYELRDESY